jgi:quercetin dioxygenase-like cupin family protein
MTAEQRVHDFLRSCSRAFVERAEQPKHVEGAAVFAERLERSTPLPFEPTWLPALDGSDAIDDTALGAEFAAVAPFLPWVPTMRATDGGTDFALATLNDVRDFGDAVVGIMYIRATTQYPVHHHPPQELYLTISGEAQWRYGGNEDFQPVGPGTTLYNHPNDVHSAIAGPDPVVALYILWP